MSFKVYELFMYFFIYSFLGWCVEVAYCAMNDGRIVNRGFLNGPVCPIYGFGMVGIIVLLGKVAANLFLVFVGGMIITTAVEFLGGWILFKKYNTRWWDYSQCPFNIGGFICLKFSVMWGLSTAAVISLVQPIIKILVDKLPFGWFFVVLGSLLMAADFVVSAVSANGLNKNIREIEKIRNSLHQKSDALSQKIGTTALDVEELLDIENVQMELLREEKLAELQEWRNDWFSKTSRLVARHRILADKLKRHKFIGQGRLLRAFPNMYHEKNLTVGHFLTEIRKVKEKL